MGPSRVVSSSAHVSGLRLRLAVNASDGLARVRSCFRAQVTEKMKLEAAQEMLRGSGMLELEQRVLRFLVGNAASIKLSAVLDDMERLLNMVSGCACVCCNYSMPQPHLQAQVQFYVLLDCAVRCET